MKQLILAAAVALVSLFTATSGMAQTDYDANQTNYFVLNRNLQQLKAISLAAGDLAKADGESFGQFQVVICGKTVEELTNAETMKPIIELAEKNNVMLNACGFSLKKFGVNATDLPKGMKVVDNGILHGFTLQKAGFHSITL
mgnify:CR=1 FL=1